MLKISSAQLTIIEQLYEGRKRILLPKYTHWQGVNFRMAIDDLIHRGYLTFKNGLTIKGKWLAHSYTERKDIVIEDNEKTGWIYRISKDTTIVVACSFSLVPFIEGYTLGQDVHIGP